MSGYRYNVLIADDEEDVTASTSAMLELLARNNRDVVRIFTALSASQVLRVISENRIDVIFLDYLFKSGMTGDDIIEHIQDPFGDRLIIMMSAHGQAELEGIVTKRHKHMGACFRFLRKPFDALEFKAKYLEIEQFLASRPYPFPIAYTRQMLSTALHGQEQVGTIKDLFESILKFAVAITMSDLHRAGAIEGLRLKIKLAEDLTLGAWLQWLDEALAYGSAHLNDAHMPELTELFAPAGGENRSEYLRMMYEFKGYRNAEYGHGFTSENDKYKSDAATYETEVKRLLRSLQFLTHYNLIVPDHLDFANDGSGDFTYDARVLMGQETVFARSRFQSPLRLKLSQVYSYGPREACLPLYPFLIYQMCDTCKKQRLYMLERIWPQTLEFNTFCNHRSNSKAAKKEFDRMFGSLLRA